MENALKALMMAAAITITCTIVAFGVYAADTAKKDASSRVTALDAYENHLRQVNYYAYDGATIAGSELLNLLRYELSQNYETRNIVYFEIIGEKTYRVTKKADIGRLTASDNADKIMPYLAYKGETIWNNGELTGIRFTLINN